MRECLGFVSVLSECLPVPNPWRKYIFVNIHYVERNFEKEYFVYSVDGPVFPADFSTSQLNGML